MPFPQKKSFFTFLVENIPIAFRVVRRAATGPAGCPTRPAGTRATTEHSTIQQPGTTHRSLNSPRSNWTARCSTSEEWNSASDDSIHSRRDALHRRGAEDHLKGCGKQSVNATLNTCAAALITANQDGYVNSRVYSRKLPEPGALEVVLGTIAELRITSEDEALQKQVQQQLSPLIGSVLHLPTLERELVQVRRRGVGQIKGGMGRLGSDPTKAVVTLDVAAATPEPLRGDFSFGNNGNVGSGEWRGVATLLQKDLIDRGDTAYFSWSSTAMENLNSGASGRHLHLSHQRHLVDYRIVRLQLSTFRGVPQTRQQLQFPHPAGCYRSKPFSMMQTIFAGQQPLPSAQTAPSFKSGRHFPLTWVVERMDGVTAAF